ASAYVLWVGVAADYFQVTANALCRGIAGIVFLDSAVNLLQLRVVHICSESILDGIHINAMAVRSNLDALLHTLGAVIHKLSRPPSITSTNQIADAELCISIERDRKSTRLNSSH